MKIEKGIPIPEDGRRGGEGAYASVAKMEVGDSLLTTATGKANAHTAAKRNGIKVISRKVGDNQYRVWRTE